MPQFCHFASPKKNHKQTTISVCFAFYQNSSRFTTFEIEKVDKWRPKKKIFLTDKSKSVASVLPKSRKTLKWRPSSSKKLEGWKKNSRRLLFFPSLLPMTFLSWPFWSPISWTCHQPWHLPKRWENVFILSSLKWIFSVKMSFMKSQKIDEKKNCKCFFALKEFVVSVEISGFFCHSDFTWNQLWRI